MKYFDKKKICAHIHTHKSNKLSYNKNKIEMGRSLLHFGLPLIF